MCSVTSEPSQSSSRRFLSFRDSSVLLNSWKVNFTKVKSFYSLAHCLQWKLRIYIGTQSKCTKRGKQSSAIKQLSETLFLAIKMCTGFTIDGICMNTVCAVSLVNHLGAVADAFSPLRTHRCYWMVRNRVSKSFLRLSSFSIVLCNLIVFQYKPYIIYIHMYIISYYIWYSCIIFIKKSAQYKER